MKLFSFPFFFLLAQTLQGIEGEVQCGNNNTVSSCFYCMFNPEANPPNEDPEYCNTSPDCMLNADSSGCVPRPENHSSQDLVPSVIRPSEAPVLPANRVPPVNDPVLPLDADSSDTNQEVFLSRIKVNLKQPDEQWSDDQFGFEVRVCNERYVCCRSGHVRTQIWGEGGSKQSIMFGARFNNLGNCGDIAKDQTLDITIPITEGYHPDLMSVTIIFEDGSIFRKQELSRSCNWLGLNCLNRPQPLLWNTRYSDVPENIPSGNRRPRVEPLPAAQCPDVHNPSANLCPKDNVRVLREKPQRKRKFCYYQECDAFSADLSSIALGQAGLGTGGYCMPRAQLNVQYEYCCELESYFTHPTLDEYGNLMERDPEDIKFPRCEVMIPHPRSAFD